MPSDAEFEDMVNWSISRLPKRYKDHLQNVAFLLSDEPSTDQQNKLNIQKDDLLFGLYEGVPLPMRGGATKILPDKITLFKKPLLAVSPDPGALKENIRHTVWHEVAHYFGLDHKRIYELDNKS